MISLILLFILLTILLYLRLGKLLRVSFTRIKKSFETIELELDRLQDEKERAIKDNLNRAQNLEEKIALYNITRQVCKFLEEEKVFATFKEEMNKFMHVKDCVFIKLPANLDALVGYLVLPLEIEGKPVGYLAALGVPDDQKEKFHILAHQFMLGIKRVLLYQRIQELAITDSLTGTFSRRYYLERFSEELERSKRFNFKFAFLMVDIDRFKDCNDKYGHLVGDAILKEVAKVIKDNIRLIDSVGRYGGEEFLIILTETDLNGARFAAERIRQAMEMKRIRVYDEELRVTISIGISVFPDDADDMTHLIEKADRALYRAKQTGRNRVCVHGVYK
ncbi:MAG TPA: GGDEF domain-containing protein [Candidatus Omnitrophota bacterium]|nr:GGDEF domain-containing protein [Candidatus Omnitrophota bacterium]HPT07676.1 GGDEF domain-containing protein [Candidatus Omnitrophota bacterium]